MIAALGDPSPAVAKTAAQLCRQLALSPTVRELARFIESAGSERRIRQLVSASYHSDKWERLALLFALRRQPMITPTLLRGLEDDWEARVNRSYMSASPDQRERLRHELSLAPAGALPNSYFWQGVVALLRAEGIAG
ncbi:MAG TPA: hypothetical protein VLF18_17530 [Tahibacter sp.]|uniref:hypothetical protein n=1 Tax=Tahibacter sp. TaxID=2056211 RepID=UPI002CC0ECA1|nr:hypothetical protein [Tahibacter sp.]HSX61992.1 hypothetical protein [Tahibacter sp.]